MGFAPPRKAILTKPLVWLGYDLRAVVLSAGDIIAVRDLDHRLRLRIGRDSGDDEGGLLGGRGERTQRVMCGTRIRPG